MGDKEPKAKRQKSKDAHRQAARTENPVPTRKTAQRKRRPSHPDGDYEALLREAEQRGWDVSRGKGYFKCKCPCVDKDYLSVVLTPSGSRTLINTTKKFERASCWKEDT